MVAITVPGPNVKPKRKGVIAITVPMKKKVEETKRKGVIAVTVPGPQKRQEIIDIVKQMQASIRPGADTTQKSIAILSMRELKKGTADPINVAREKVLRSKSKKVAITVPGPNVKPKRKGVIAITVPMKKKVEETKRKGVIAVTVPGPQKRQEIIDIVKQMQASIRPGADTTQKSIAILSMRELKKGTADPLNVAREKVLRSKSQKMDIRAWMAHHPGPHPVHVPSSEYGTYDVVREGYPVVDESGNFVPGYQFEYSDKAQHKIMIAGSIENYDAYLREVRSKQFLPIVNAILGSSLNIDLARASNKPGITGASEREEILIKLLHRFKGKPGGFETFDPGRFALGAAQSPFVQMGLTFGIGYGVGKVGGRVAGYLAARYGPRAVQAFQIAQVAAGGALTYPKAKEIVDNAAKGKTGKAAEDAVILALLITAGVAGYRAGSSSKIIFGKHKGLTQYEAGFTKGLVKSKIFDPLQKEYYNLISDIKQDLRTRNIMPLQEEPTFSNVKALKQFNQLKVNVLKQTIKNQLVALKNRAQVTGGAATEKVSTHDIDELFRSAKDPVVLEYIARKLGIDPNQVFDIHGLPRTGARIDITGTVKESPYVYPSGQRGIKLTEQFYRLAESGGQLKHSGRIKDIPEAVRILNLVYSKSGGIPKNMQPKVNRFMEIASILQQDPRMMDPAMAKVLYSSGIGKKLWDIRIKFYQKVLPKTYLNKQFNALTKSDLNTLQAAVTQQQSGYLPSSMSMPFSQSPFVMSNWSLFYQLLSGSPGPSGWPTSTSQPGVPSSPPVVPPGPGPSYPGSSDKSGYTPPPPGSSRYRIDDDSYVPPQPDDKYYTEQPGKSTYYHYGEYPSYPTYPSEQRPPPPEFLWFPGMGGKIKSKGRGSPYSVRYYNEYMAVQNLLRRVIF